MPYTAQHKARTRAKIVESARVMFNRRGFDQVSIDEIMAHAGLTRGGFYNHFSSKDELYGEAIRSFLTCNPFTRQEAASTCSPPRPQELARRLIELYLSDVILADVDQHCPLVALPSDAARAGLQPRAAYTQLVEGMLSVFEAAFPDDADGRRNAMLILSLCVGGMVIARTTDDPELRTTLRAAARAQALDLLGSAATVEPRRARSRARARP